jgi:hypothetical protein
MLKLKEFKKNFHHHELPDAIARLVEFQNSQPGPFCRGFSLALDDKATLMPFSEKREFLDALCPLGQANRSGSRYVLWTREVAKDVAAAPVLAFGDQGGVHAVAENALQLMRLLTLDAEPMIDRESLIFMKDEGEVASPGAHDYAIWLEHHFHQKPVKDVVEAELMVRSAQSLLEKPLQTWLRHFQR